MFQFIYDLIGIGIGPFNLGLAALSASIPELQSIFFDQMPEFNWHPGLMIENARLQVPFLADLVTLADPCSPFSYLSFLHATKKLFQFAISENYFPTRKEYNQYCKWVADQLPSLRFGIRCEEVKFNPLLDCFDVRVLNVQTGTTTVFHGKHLAIGIGTGPSIPGCIKELKHRNIFHSCDYLFKKEALRVGSSIIIVGSGQSAAEIFYDLLQNGKKFESVNWFTRADRFYPMEYSKLTLEMTSPDYIDYFYNLSPEMKKKTLLRQDMLYGGINFSLINDIYDHLVMGSLEDSRKRVNIHTNCELKKVSVLSEEAIKLTFDHQMLEREFEFATDVLILATGYSHSVPEFLEPVKELIGWTEDGLYEVKRNYAVDAQDSIFVQNADLHTHGFNSADLGMGPYRNAIILNTILASDYFKLETKVAFQTFGLPDTDSRNGLNGHFLKNIYKTTEQK